MSNTRQEKHEKFTAPKKNNSSLMIILGVVIVAVVALGGYYLKSDKGNTQAAYNIGNSTNYQNVEMTDVTNTVENGKIAINLEDVKKAGIIYTEYNKGGKKVALTSWISPNGDVVAAVSMCEPCRGYKFHIEGSELVCNACGTRWTLDKLEGVSGGCLQYPPDALKYEVKDGKILIDEAPVQNWQPRA